MTWFTDTVKTATALEHTIRSILRHFHYRTYTVADLPPLGDGLLLCRGSIVLRLLGCKYTHVAIVKDGYVYESIEIIGVTKVPIQEFLNEYLIGYNTVKYVKISQPFDETILNTTFNKYASKPYETSGEEFIAAKFRLNKKEDKKSYFCSEFVAQMLQDMGLLSGSKLPNNYSPDDFVNLPLIGCYLQIL